MKYIAFIVLGLVLLAAIAGIVLRANMPTAKLTVHAVRPMGTNVILFPSPDELLSWPVWEVAITNSGRAPADWYVSLVVWKGESGQCTPVGTGRVRPHGVLSPGQWTNVYMPQPRFY